MSPASPEESHAAARACPWRRRAQTRATMLAAATLVMLTSVGCSGDTTSPAPGQARGDEHDDALEPTESNEEETSPPNTPESGTYWAGIDRELPVAPSGNVVAVSCHNCYEERLASPDDNLAATLAKLHAAQAAGADLLELDVKLEQGQWLVGHNDDGFLTGAALEDVVADVALVDGDQVLYVEIKEDNAPERDSVRDLIAILSAPGLVVRGRDLVLRAFRSRAPMLEIARQVLDQGDFPDHVALIRLQLLYNEAEGEEAEPDALAAQAVEAGMAGVEFNYRSRNVFELLQAARARGLGTNVWTFDVEHGSADCRAFRDFTDAVTTDSPPAECRSAIEGP